MNSNSGKSSRDRKLDELAKIAFVGSLSEAFGHYGAALRTVASRWDTELALASTDARKALGTMQGRWLGLDGASRRAKARRVARRLRRAQTLVSGVSKRAERFPKEYARQFMTIDAAKKRIGEGRS
jgi:hypothetical protein